MNKGLTSTMAEQSMGAAVLCPYLVPDIYDISEEYALKANGISLPLTTYTKDYDYASFSVTAGKVTYELTLLDETEINSYTISPLKLNISATITGNMMRFTVDRDEYLIIRINDRAKRLVLAADPVESDVPEETGEGVFHIALEPFNVVPVAAESEVAARTAAIQRALDDASQYGTERGNGAQGIVYVPAGTYFISNLVIKSNTAVYMEPGSVFISTSKWSDLQEHWFKDSVGKPVTWWISTAYESTNIKLFGRGTIDGNGEALSDDGMINNLLVPIATSKFEVDGITVRNASAWAITTIRSKEMNFVNLKMFNSLNMGENDGIDVCESQNVVVRNAIGIGLDDPFSTKAWKETTDIASGKVGWPGKPEPVADVLFEDCIAWTICYGFKIGQGVMQNQENITFRDCVVYDAAVGFGIHHKYGTAEAKQITFENMEIENITYMNDDNSAWMTMFIVNGNELGIGPISNVRVKNIKVYDNGKGRGSAKIQGVQGATITDVIFQNIYMPGSHKAAENLTEMNFLIQEFNSQVTILKEQN
ncbi:glycosyl hydrolase family 28 protein [Paenibacillus alginolyticus]|nr:glycosyl hydrolase family 28 protein [Paenibacillus alginolyticus]MEC0147750.1 glycosyl hydrolase family 28 protein [Paenibacillus alginolyticus]